MSTTTLSDKQLARLACLVADKLQKKKNGDEHDERRKDELRGAEYNLMRVCAMKPHWFLCGTMSHDTWEADLISAQMRLEKLKR